MRVQLVAHTIINQSIPNYTDQPSGPWNPLFVEYTEDADQLAEQAGRLCYLSWNRPNPETATNKGYLANILAQGHFSVLEHGSATFYIDGVTRNFTHELIRHRHLSFSEVSQRYVDGSEFGFAVHPGLQLTSDRNENLIDSAVHNSKLLYGEIVDDLESKGMKRKEARQAARHVLPGGIETKILVTGNMRAWREVLAKRLSSAADKEFQLVAKELLNWLKNLAPNSFQDMEIPSE